MRYRLAAADGTACVVADGRIAHADAPCEFTVELGQARLLPGLINAHDHLHRNHYPRLGAPPYEDVYAWGEDLHGRWKDDVARCRALDRNDALLFGALKNLLGGATTVVHHDRWEPAFDDAFPVRVVRTRVAHSLRLEPDLARAADGGPMLRDRPLCIHLAEGTNAAAADEIRALADLGLVDRSLIAVHVVGADDDGIRRLRDAGAAVVWCPTSNAFLYERTAPAALLAEGMDVLLGSDALLTGEGTLLDELRAARALALLDDARLTAAVGETAARRLGLPAPRLAPGAAADLVALRRPLLEARAADVELVVVGGVPRLGDERHGELFERCGVATERLRVGRADKLVARPLASVAQRVFDLSPDCARIVEDREGPNG
jgi:cytosine/adenosine deaminase-related metal-dependent hydrolase